MTGFNVGDDRGHEVLVPEPMPELRVELSESELNRLLIDYYTADETPDSGQVVSDIPPGGWRVTHTVSTVVEGNGFDASEALTAALSGLTQGSSHNIPGGENRHPSLDPTEAYLLGRQIARRKRRVATAVGAVVGAALLMLSPFPTKVYEGFGASGRFSVATVVRNVQELSEEDQSGPTPSPTADAPTPTPRPTATGGA